MISVNARLTKPARAALLSAALALCAPAQPGRGAEASPASAREGVVEIGPANLSPTQPPGMMAAQVRFPQAASRRAIGAAASADPSREGRQLGGLVARGLAAGNHGDLYDNRDRDHSFFHAHHRPLVTRVRYDEALRAQGLDYGLNDRLIFDAPTIGNASVAVAHGPHWRSMPRLALTRPRAPAALARLYAANALYVYPEHRDHDPDFGDVFPANTPYYVVSQGSSGSDRAFVLALLDALAALKPETKAFLRERDWLAPTLQMLLRKSMAGIETEADYLSGAAHPTVFNEARIDRGRLIRAAQALTPETTPPPARIAVAAEAAEGPEPDPLAGPAAERLFDTPYAVARIALGPAPLRRYRLRAAATDAEGASVPTVWRVLRGRATLTVSEGAREATLEVPWGRPEPVPGAADGEGAILSSRVDVAVFAQTPHGAGAPAFFSLSFPADRRVETDADGRLLAVDYDARPEGAYVDPTLWPRRAWRDSFRYDPEGRLLGWRRARADDSTDDYARHGGRVISRDALGRPRDVATVAYSLGPPAGPERRPQVIEADAGGVLRYDYAGPDDRLGVLTAP